MLKVANSVINASQITGVLPVANGGTNASTASITSFNNITGFTASGTTGTTSTNLVFATTPTLVGDVTLSTGNLVIGTAGKGIDFSITTSGSGTMTSELLADYEEGTWTPAFTFVTPGTSSFVYGTQTGHYTKVGNLVTLQFVLTVNSATVGTGSGFLLITGQPFVGKSGITQSGSVSYASGYTVNMPTTFEILTSSFYVLSQPSNVAGTLISATNVPGGGTNLYGWITYLV